MSLINSKVELRHKWTYCSFLCEVGVDIVDANPNNVIFITKYTKLYFLVVILSATENQKLLKLLAKKLERSVYWNK